MMVAKDKHSAVSKQAFQISQDQSKIQRVNINLQQTLQNKANVCTKDSLQQ